ncbi:multiheme c-type cytochrome [Shewanella sp. TC10]|uniref:multiheme c-type cytochrome n=1 Tax=Shewanella sp. TC10 TaxID=1419739 RepID=UPI00129DEDAA|nr:multiheme c-type cytochrome [Shewanella sp. TC10]
MKKFTQRIFISCIALMSFSSLSANASWDDDKGCLSCHEGIEQFSDVDMMVDLSCVDCHNGNASATTLEAGHKDMWSNPTDLRIVSETCGSCHADEVDNAKTSIHATMSGMISGTRYNFGSQDRNSVYATYDVKALKVGREGTVESLKQIPSYDPTLPESATNSPSDDYLRNQCLRCHIWSDGHQRDGDYRASGCAACHVEYSNNATYEGDDKAIDKSKKDRPRKHKMTTKITVNQCAHCHNRGGRSGMSYQGMMESDGYGTPYTETGGKQGKLHGKHYNFLEADLHFDAGMSCIDCHTKAEMHGDGYLYTKKNHALEVRCESCHGTSSSDATLKTARDNPMVHLKRNGKKVTLTTKIEGKELNVPQLYKNKELSEEGYVAMVKIASHMEKMECSTCHAAWAPQCYGCHATQNVGKPNGDWLNGSSDDKSAEGKKSNLNKEAFSWSESRSYVRWEMPALGINGRGKVSTFVPGCQVFLTQVDGEKSIINNKIYTTTDGTSGLSHNPIQPHTMSKRSRTCEECHTNPKVLGLGSGVYDVEKNFPEGQAPAFELERFVDEEGNQLQSTSHEGARPFNKEEMDRISRVGSCLACHGSDEIGTTGQAPNDITHNKVIRKMAENGN